MINIFFSWLKRLDRDGADSSIIHSHLYVNHVTYLKIHVTLQQENILYLKYKLFNITSKGIKKWGNLILLLK